MFPIPCLFLMIENGTVPLLPGNVKKIAVTRYQNGSSYNSMAILLNDGSLYTQGDNAYGECADGSQTAYYNVWKLAETNVADVFGVGMTFVIKYNTDVWKFAGAGTSQLGSGGNATTWTNLSSTISSVITLSNIKNLTGTSGGTLFLMNNGTLYGSGANASGCLGSGNTNSITSPRTISTTAKRAFALNACMSYLENTGIPKVAGFTYGIQGGDASPITTSTFNTVTFTSVGETVYAKEWLCNESYHMAIGSTGASDNSNYLYTKGINSSNYSKMSSFGPFTTFRVIDGGQSSFLIADDVLYALGQSAGQLGLGPGGIVTSPTIVPVPTGTDWDLSKLTCIVDLKTTTMSAGTAFTHFMVYDGNLFYAGNPRNFFGLGTTPVSFFTNIPESSVA